MAKPTKKDLLSKTKLEFYNEIKKYQQEFKPSKEIEGYASAAIVGEKNYPNLKVYNISNEKKDRTHAVGINARAKAKDKNRK